MGIARWAGTASTQSVATEGGNITQVNVSATALTDKWALFYGNVTGTVVLRDSASTAYTWTYSSGGSGEVCVSTATTFPSGTLANASASNIDTLWGLGISDNAINTLNNTCPSDIIVNGQTVTTPVAIKIQGDSNFYTCGLQTGTGAKNNYAFCTNISDSGINYANSPNNYELMVPTTPGAGTETYYFYIELS